MAYRVLVTLAFVLVAGLPAQSFYLYPTGADPRQCVAGPCAGNAVPFQASFANDCSQQMHIPASALPRQGGLLTDLAFVFYYTGVRTYPDLRVSIGHDTPAGLSCADFSSNSADFQLQFSGPHSFAYTYQQWSSFGVPLNFLYDGVRGLVIEIRHRGGTGGGPVYYTGPADGLSRVSNWRAGGFTANSCYLPVDLTAPKIRIGWIPGPPPAPTVMPYGTGCGTPALTLAANGLPTLGNVTFFLDLQNGPPSSPAYLFAALGAAAVPTPLGGGCELFLDLQEVLTFLSQGINPWAVLPTGPGGAVAFSLPVPGDPALAGFRIDFQAAVSDASAPVGFVVSNAVALTLN